MDFLRWAATLGGECHLCGNASNAYKGLLVFLRGLRHGGRVNVVLPTYLPAKLWRATLAAGCEARFYAVDERCAPDLGSIEALVDGGTIAVLAVHYFGFPAPIDEITAIARRGGACLIEDCALTLGGADRGRPLGTIGHASIFSMRKMLLYSEGGLLRVGDELQGLRLRYERRVASAWSLQHFLRQRAKRLYVRATGGADPLGLCTLGPLGHMDWSRPQELDVKRPSHFTEQRLRFSDVERAIARRRRNYQRIAARVPSTPRLSLLHPVLPDDVTPYALPVLVHDGTRDALRQALLRRGVVSGAGWPESPFDRRHRGAARLAASLLELPVHQALTDAQVERTISAIEELRDPGSRRELEAAAQTTGAGRLR